MQCSIGMAIGLLSACIRYEITYVFKIWHHLQYACFWLQKVIIIIIMQCLMHHMSVIRMTNCRHKVTVYTKYIHAYIHPFNSRFYGTTLVSRYQKGKTNLDFTEAGDSEWQWYQLGHMQVCTPLQTDNNASTPPLSFLQEGCPSCRPTNSVKALKALYKSSKAVYQLTDRQHRSFN